MKNDLFRDLAASYGIEYEERAQTFTFISPLAQKNITLSADGDSYRMMFCGKEKLLHDEEDAAEFVSRLITGELVLLRLTCANGEIFFGFTEESSLGGIGYAEAERIFGCEKEKLDGCRYSVISRSGNDEKGTVADNRSAFGFMRLPEKTDNKRHRRHSKYDIADSLGRRNRLNRILLPTYTGLMCFFLVFFGALMKYDSERFFAEGMAILFLSIALTAFLLIKYGVVRKNEIKSETEKYNFNFAEVKPREKYIFSSDMGAAVFDGRGVYIGGKMYSYTDTEVTLHTDNSFHHVNISFVFSFCDRQSLYIPVSAESITMLEQFGIEPQNRGLLYALRYDTYETVKNIYYGKQV